MRTLPAVLVALLLVALFSAAPASAASPVEEKYTELGDAGSFLGAPTTPEKTAPDGVGKYRHYAGGSIYWHPQTGAHAVRGLIRQAWADQGWEQSFLGYPLTDEIDTVSGAGKVTRFQGGDLIWRPQTNQVATVRSTDLILDWPFPVGEAWEVLKTNADHHGGAWAHCLDMILAGKEDEAARSQKSAGRPFTAAAEAKLAWVDENPLRPGPGNIIVQRAGEGRYVSYLHHAAGTFAKRFGAGRPGAAVLTTQGIPWNQRPVAKGGTPLAEIGDSGMAEGSFHMHFCVTTKPDRERFAKFESVPVAFRNYSSSTDQGATWTYVAKGVPALHAWIRREGPRKDAPPLHVNDAVTSLDYGTVAGTISPPPSGGKPVGAGKLTVTAVSEWGEPLRTTVVEVPANAPGGPWSYLLDDVPAWDDVKVTATYAGGWTTLTKVGTIAANSGPFAVKPAATVTRNLVLKTP
jgi:hypothetical protein